MKSISFPAVAICVVAALCAAGGNMVAAVPVNTTGEGNAAMRDMMADTWVATDAVGRRMPEADTIAGRRGLDRTVGIFYITWHDAGLYDSPEAYRDVTTTLDADPQARITDCTGLWSPPSNMGSYHWGEPETGYFLSDDPYVMRRDMSMLADAGVDVIILDVTNGVCYWKEWDKLFEVMEEMKGAGNPVPKICFWTFNGYPLTCAQQIYERYYKPGLYRDLWFYWDGKPLLLCNMSPQLDANGEGVHNPNPHYDPTAATDPSHPRFGDPELTEEFYTDYTDSVKDFFTLRNMWWGYDSWGGKPYAGTEDNWCFGYEMNDPAVSGRPAAGRAATHCGQPEQMAVTAGQHPLSLTGKCWRIDGGEPPLNDRDMVERAYVPWLGREVEHPEAYGIYFQDRWEEALSVDPKFIYINDWNEWTAGKYRTGKFPDGKPNGPDRFMGRTDNTFYFVDQYNAEFNRTIQPAKGIWGDNYYMQMVQNIRRYKGAREVPSHKGVNRKMKTDGDFGDWAEIVSYYFDTRGDVDHRDHNGYAGRHYTDTSGRNDIVEAKVAVGKKNIYFYARTDSALTEPTDSGWMLLLLDTDCDSATGWNGYDFIVNRGVKEDGTTTLMRYDNNVSEWVTVAEVPYSVEGSELELKIPRRLVGLTSDALTFDFKWADNPQSLSDFTIFCTTGDTAPNRRFNYRYRWEN